MGGPRTALLIRADADFDLAVRLRQGNTTIGEVYSFVSGLYFRGKLAYAKAFGASPENISAASVIVPGLGLVHPNMALNCEQLRRIGSIPADESLDEFIGPLLRTALNLNDEAGPDCRYVLLGSIATGKYTRPLLNVFGDRLLFPADFVGRGNMSRGGLMLRCARSGDELSYVAVLGATLRGPRPPKLKP